MSELWYYIGVIVCVALSGYFSASEMALSSANRMRLTNSMEGGSRSAGVAVALLNRYDDTLSTILIGNNLVNNAASALTTVIAMLLAKKLSGSEGLYTTISTVVVTALIIVFGETMPKIIAKKKSNSLSMAFAPSLRVLMIILLPLNFVVVKLVSLIVKRAKAPDENDDDAAVDELVSIIETVEDEGVIDGDRSELLQAALDFKEISASEAMTSRVDMEAIDIDDPWEEQLELIFSSPYSRLPVYQDGKDNIIGILYLNHFFKALTDSERVDIRSLLMPPCHVYKTVKLPAVLAELRRCKTHIAIVTDEYGGCMGTVTMEDVLEEIVGDIWDETDEVTNEIVERPDGVTELDGDMVTGDLIDMMGWDEYDFDYESDTVGGWMIEMFGGFPTEGESFEYMGSKFTVLAMDGLRVDRVAVERPKEEEQ